MKPVRPWGFAFATGRYGCVSYLWAPTPTARIIAMTPAFDAVLRDVGGARDLTGFVAAATRARDEALVAAHARDVVEAARRWSAFARCAVAGAAGVVGSEVRISWRWYVSGSTGRGDALPGADVETLMVIDGDRATALAAAAHVHALLDSVGLRADANGAIAARSRFARTDADWCHGIEAWTRRPAADRGVVMTGLIADAAPAGPDPDSATDLPACLRTALLAPHSTGLSAMLEDTLVVRESVPSRLRVVAGGRDTVDVKRAVVDPITKLARWAALTVGSGASSTLDRLRDGAELLPDDAAATLADCWRLGTRVRWALRADAVRHGGDIRDDFALSVLAPQDRAHLRSAGRDVAGVLRVLNYTRPDRLARR